MARLGTVLTRVLQQVQRHAEGKPGHPVSVSVLKPVLMVLTLDYMAATAARHWAARTGLLPGPRRCLGGVRTVSVGNLTWGGSGKTPVTQYLAKVCLDAGRVPLVACRGGAAADEAAMLAAALPGAVLAVGADRVVACQAAAPTSRGIDVVLLDDALQHRRAARDADVIVVNARIGFGNGWRLPYGCLRDPLDKLSCAKVVVLHNADRVAASTRGDLLRQIRRHALPGAAVAETSLRVQGVVNAATGQLCDVQTLRQLGQAVVAVTGIAHPYAMCRDLAQDHRLAVARVLADLDHRMTTLPPPRPGVVYLTTAKDAARVAPCLLAQRTDLWVTQTQLCVLSGRGALHRLLGVASTSMM